jgi:colanic acid/amylovoran biosynthesis glycosyltransferase
MRIAFFVWQFPVISQTFVLNQIAGLLERGHEVDIYAYLPGHVSEAHPLVERYQLLKRTFYAPEIPKNSVRYVLKGAKLFWQNLQRKPWVALRSLNIFHYGKRTISLWLIYAMTPLLDQRPYDIIHAQFGTDGLNAMFLRDVGAIEGKLITSFRGFDITAYVYQKGNRVYNRLFQVGDFFLTSCNFFANLLLETGCSPEKIEVHYSGIDCDRFDHPPRSYPKDGMIRIITTGRLEEKKGIEYTIRAVAQLAKTYPNLEYNIIGDGSLRDELEHLVQTLEVAHFVKLLGQKQQQEIIEMLKQSHVFIAASVTAKDNNSDAPNVLKEAMATRLPVVSTLHGGIPELVQDGISGFLVPERDVNALAEKLAYLVAHPEVWAAMGKAGRNYVKAHFDTEILNDRLVEIYQNLAIQN